MPTLITQEKEAATFEAKAHMLKEQFFPALKQADLADIEGFDYPPSLDPGGPFEADEIGYKIKRQHPSKAPGLTGIPNAVLKMAVEWILPYMLNLVNACLKIGHHPKAFKDSNTIVAKKQPKQNQTYADPSMYRPITLL